MYHLREEQQEKIVNGICGYGWQCRDKQGCKSMHPGEKGFDYLLQKEKLRLTQVCPGGNGCIQKGWCIYLHPGEKVNKRCMILQCRGEDCYFLHNNTFDITPEQMNMMKLTQEEKTCKAQEMKDRGNILFKQSKFLEAIEQYSLAIVYYQGIHSYILQGMIPQDSVFFSNRAQCYKKLNKWDLVMLDSEQAIEYDPNNLRAKVLLVISICEQSKNSQISEIIQILSNQLESIKQIEAQGLELNKEPFKDLKSMSRKIEELRNLKTQEVEMLDKYFFINTIRNVISRSSLPPVKIQELASLMANLDQKPMEQECPEYFQCNISFELFKDPLLTPQGITFEKECLESHFQKNGRNDPITRTPISQKILYNRSIYDGVQHYKKTVQSQQDNIFTLPIIHQLMQAIHFD